MSDSIILTIECQIARITLNRPSRLNSFNAQMHQALRDALDELHNATPSVRVLLITGAGRGFCAGQDLYDRQVGYGEVPPDLGASLDQWYNPLIRRLKTMPIPIICAVNGVAVGAGASIALACDFVIASRKASFVQAFCQLGLVPDSGSTWHLPRALGTPRAMGAAMLGDKISAAQAADWGMIWAAVNHDELANKVDALAAHLVQQPTAGLGKIKQAIYAATTNTLDEQLDLERDLQTEAGKSSDYREGVTAFMEKRSPNFQGC